MSVHVMWDDYPQLKSELEAVKQIMLDAIQLSNSDVKQAILTMIEDGGKMLRPAFSLLFSGFQEERDLKKVYAITASLEFLHLATLMHDDVIDDSDSRRGHATLNAQFGNRVAIYAGDYLLTVCYNLLADYVDDLTGIKRPVNGMEKVVDGELMQMKRRYGIDISIQDYLNQIEGKTAELFSLSCYSGAYYADPKETKGIAIRSKRIGYNIGMAFQLLDDILDYTESSQNLGKPVLEDVRQGVYSAPLIYALQSQPGPLIKLLEKKASLSDKDLLKVQKLVIKHGGVEKAKSLAELYTKKALNQIEELPPCTSRDQLAQLTKQLLERKF